MNTPVFSCVIPVKGARPYFDEALASLQNQDLGDALEIIVQDGDYDGRVEHVERVGEVGDMRWFREGDAGQSDALNKGFAKAHGNWFFWLNADDVLLPGALKNVQQLITHNSQLTTHTNWIVGNQLLIDEKGKVLKCSVGNGWHDWLYRHAVPHVYGPSSFFRRELFERVGGFDTSLKCCMDWDLWIKFMKAGARFKRIDEYLWAQRQWSGSKTQRKLSKDEFEVQQAEVRAMLAKNGLDVTSGGKWLNRAWRMLNGNYIKECFDTFRMRGKCVG